MILNKQNKKFCIFRNFYLASSVISKILNDITIQPKIFKIPNYEQEFEYQSNLEPFLALKSLLIKILFDQVVYKSQLEKLSALETEILTLFTRKKKFYGYRNARANVEFYKTARLNPIKKSKEENLKFVFKKGFKFLKNKIFQHISIKLFEQLKPELTQLCETAKKEYVFTAIYFQKAAIRKSENLENFMQPSMSRNYKIFNQETAPKSVNRRYLELIKGSKGFLRHFRQYLRRHFVNEAKQQAVKKTEELVSKWEEIYLEKGSAFLRKKVYSQFSNNSKTKLPWSSSEIEFSMKQILMLLQ